MNDHAFLFQRECNAAQLTATHGKAVEPGCWPGIFARRFGRVGPASVETALGRSKIISKR